MKHTTEELRELQSKSLEEKIQISTARIIEWYEKWDGNDRRICFAAKNMD